MRRLLYSTYFTYLKVGVLGEVAAVSPQNKLTNSYDDVKKALALADAVEAVSLASPGSSFATEIPVENFSSMNIVDRNRVCRQKSGQSRRKW